MSPAWRRDRWARLGPGRGPGRGRRESARLDAFLAEVEPGLAARPRVHRFAEVPRVGPAGLPPEGLPVLVEGGGDAARARTLRSLHAQTVRPAAVLTAGADGVADDAWLAVVRGGDVLAPGALERLGQAVRLVPEAVLVTCDEDELDRAGRRRAPVLRPGPSPDLLRSVDLTSSLVAVRRRALGAGAPSRPWRYRAALACRASELAHVPLILNHRPGGAARGPALLERPRGWAPDPVEPAVAVVVLFRDRPALLERCTGSLLARTTYGRLELWLVDNGSTDPALGPLLSRLARHPRVRIVRDARPFNFSALNNAVARTTTADVLVFLNNDTEVLTPTWVEDLLAHARREEVGAVAPLLLYPGGAVQHAGAALGLHGFAGHPFAGLAPDAGTPFGTARDGVRNWLAVTAACLMVERRKLAAVGGFDEGFVVAGNDVDLGLRLTARGFRSLCVPAVELVHHEGRSRGRTVGPEDPARSVRSYGAFLRVGDPFYNPNLTLARTDCGLRLPGEPG